ncbi:Synembryn-A [Chamberlinius hualienensis]
MDEAAIGFIENSNDDDFLRILKEFNTKNAQTMTFEDLSIGDLRGRLWRALFERLKRVNENAESTLIILEAVRILSRDKTALDEIITPEIGKSLAGLSGLSPAKDITSAGIKVVVEAQKCLCNLIYNCLTVQRLCCVNGCVEGIVERLKAFKDPNVTYDIKYFDMKMLFLLTALCPDLRTRLKAELHGMTYLVELLSLISQHYHGKNEENKTDDRKTHKKQSCFVDDQTVELTCEVLKTLFNLTVDVDKGNVDEDDEIQFSRLVAILRDLLLCSTSTASKQEELQSHTINLLTNMPFESSENLVNALLDSTENKDFEFEGHNIEAIACLLIFLEMKLEKPDKLLREKLSPILTCLIECARSSRIVRKYLRSRILPPLRDVFTRPEEGETSRNKLNRLLTHPLVEVKDLAAELLFVLCKENVGRLIKYSGYGNAAGLLASRGLVSARDRKDRYSSESEDSETEEYKAVKEDINPVIGCYDEPKPDPLAGMTEEQKEYEVMQLVNMMNKLTETGVVTPMKMDEKGKLKPVEHMLELRDEGFKLMKSKHPTDRNDEDSDLED